jgi:hypothetical protein
MSNGRSWNLCFLSRNGIPADQDARHATYDRLSMLFSMSIRPSGSGGVAHRLFRRWREATSQDMGGWWLCSRVAVDLGAGLEANPQGRLRGGGASGQGLSSRPVPLGRRADVCLVVELSSAQVRLRSINRQQCSDDSDQHDSSATESTGMMGFKTASNLVHDQMEQGIQKRPSAAGTYCEGDTMP